MDQLVKIIHVGDVVGFDPHTLLPLRSKQVDFMVGNHGPFHLVTPGDQFTPEYVEHETQKVVDTLRATHAIPAA